MADVWSSLDEVLERHVAVKILKPVLTGDPVALARFRREARLAARVNHPNVVAVYDTVSGEGCDAMVQELVAGKTLREVLDERPKLGIGETVRLGTHLADALTAVHAVGIVHRDVKPANVLLADDGRVLLTDFGIATRGSQDLTSDDVMMGTAKYLSPEQVEGRPASARADLYALGVVLYECLAGRAPFQADSDAATALARLRADPIPLRTLRPGIPSRLATLVRACLARTPEDRPRSALVLRDALASLAPQVVEDAPPARARRDPAPPPTNGEVDAADVAIDDGDAGDPAPRRRRRWPLLAAGAAVTTTVAAAGLSVFASRPVGDPGQPPPDASAAAAAVVTVVTPAATATTSATATSPAATIDASTTAPAGAVAIVSVGEFDPPPGDGRENPGLLGNLTDGKAQTVWSSLCYDEVGMGAKEGVGLVFELSGSAAGRRLEITSTTRGWAASVFVSDVRPSSVRALGPPVSARRDVSAATTSFSLEDAAGRYVLLWFTRLGASPVCKLPYDVRVAEVRLA